MGAANRNRRLHSFFIMRVFIGIYRVIFAICIFYFRGIYGMIYNRKMFDVIDVGMHL